MLCFLGFVSFEIFPCGIWHYIVRRNIRVNPAPKQETQLEKKGSSYLALHRPSLHSPHTPNRGGSSLTFQQLNNPSSTLPFTNQQQIPIDIYLYASAAVTITLWATICLIAVDNLVEEFLNKILSDAKTQTTTEAQILERKSEILAEVKNIQLIKEKIEKTRIEMGSFKK